MGLVEFGKHHGILHFIKTEKASKWGVQIARMINLMLDNEIGEKRSESVQTALNVWIKELADSIRIELNKI